MKFTLTSRDKNYTVTVDCEENSLGNVICVFEKFLRASGFTFSGSLGLLPLEKSNLLSPDKPELFCGNPLKENKMPTDKRLPPESYAALQNDLDDGGSANEDPNVIQENVICS